MAEFTNIKINDVQYDVKDANAARASALTTKQDVISDLSAIRSGAALGATSVQTISVNGGTAQQPTNGVVNLTIATGGDNDLVGLSDGTENDGAVVFTKRNGDTITLNLNHVHPQYVESDDLAEVATSGSYNDLSDKPTLFSGNYNDLSNKPTIPAAQVNADWNATSGVSRILNKPTIPTVPTNVSSFTNDAGYLTQHQSLANYYTKSEIDTKIGNIETLLASI